MSEKLLTDSEISALLAHAESSEPPLEKAVGEQAPSYRYFKPTGEGVDRWIDYIQSTEEGYRFGIRDLDIRMRGIYPSDVLVITGRAHSGKSQVCLSSIVHNLHANPDFKAIIYTPDEPQMLVIQKLFSLYYQRNAEEVETRIEAHDPAILSEIRNAKNTVFNNIAILDGPLTFSQMSDALHEAQDFWQDTPKIAMVDYLEQLPGPGGYEGVSSLLKGVKQWAKDEAMPVALIHQSGKGAKRGMSSGLEAGKFNADEYAIMQLDVYRKREKDGLSYAERCFHSVSITLDLCKNKKPPCDLYAGDFFMDPQCGLIRDYFEEDIPTDDRWMS